MSNARATAEQARAAVRAHALLLAWYREMGVDAAVAAEPTNWLERGDTRPGAGFDIPALAEPAPPPRATARAPQAPSPASHQQRASLAKPALRPAPAPTATRPFAATVPDDAIAAARESARAATSLGDLAARLAAFDGCGLSKTAKSLCFYRGATHARLLVIGDAPGAEEDKLGKPFVGPAGQMLDKMLAAIGLDETGVHMTNLVYWRPPGNRAATPEELAICQPFLERQFDLVAPTHVLLLGGVAANQILATPGGIPRLRGKWKTIEIAGRSLQALATFHPRDLVKTPLSKRMAWRDLLAIATALEAKGGA